jgi:CRISPR-associated protein Cas2
MWILAMFDLPVDSRESKREYVRFRKDLLAQGFAMLQYSVYARYCSSHERAQTYLRRIKAGLPPEGQIRLLSVTEKQFGDMVVYSAGEREKPEDRPEQLLLF